MAPPPNSTDKKSELSAKDQNVLKSISKLFDEKKFKKGLKTVDGFLKSHPENLDALCFKCLIVYNLGKKEEAYDISKQVLRKNLTSSMAWHTLGFLHKSDKNYTEALKCFRAAGKHNKDNQQIMKDLVGVQLFLRDISGLRETYSALLQASPAVKGNWIGLIQSYHLLGNQKQALHILDKFVEILDEKEMKGVTYSELLCYKAMLFDELNDYDQLLKFLKDNDKLIFDKIWSRKKQVEVYMKKNQLEQAEKLLKDLIKMNPDDANLQLKLVELKGVKITCQKDYDNLTQDQIELVDNVNQELKKLYPKSLLIQRLPLNYLKVDSQRFNDELFEYVKQFLRKGIPSLFNNLKSLYQNEKKRDEIEKLFIRELESLKKTGKFSDSSNESEKELPSVLLWTIFYLSQHFDKKSDYSKALEYCEEALVHTPTCLDVHVIKAKIYKHQGDFSKAFNEYNQARELDLADRYLNTKSAKYALRNNDPFTADQIVSLVKDERNPLVDSISEFQCMWYEKELGDAYQSTGNYSRALKNYYLIDRHFSEFQEDQFDFHYHIQKKLTLRSYIEFLRWEDNIYQNREYTQATKEIIKIYLNLYKKNANEGNVKKYPSVLKNIDQFEASNQTHRELQEKMVKESKTKDTEGNPIALDDDPNGDKLISSYSSDYLVPASKFLKNLLKFNSNNLETQKLSCEVYLIKKKYLMVLKSLLKIKELVGNQNPYYHYYLIKLFNQIDNDTTSTVKDQVKSLLNQERELLIGTKSLVNLNNEFLQLNKNSIEHRFIGAQVLLLLDSTKVKESTDLLLDLSNTTTSDWKISLEIYKYLLDSNETLAETYRNQCNTKYPLTNCFQLISSTSNTTTITAPIENNSDNKQN